MKMRDKGQNAGWECCRNEEPQTSATAGTRGERPEARPQSHTSPLLHWDPGSLALWHRIKMARFPFLRCVSCMHMRVHPLVCNHMKTSDTLLYQSHVSGINFHLIF